MGDVVQKVIFVRQPTYRQSAGARKRKGKQWAHGELIHGSKMVDAAADLVKRELGIDAIVFEHPAEKLYAGFVVKDGELWQDPSTCRSYTSNGVDFTQDNKLALWYDAEHPSEAGAEQHLRCLICA